jgi:hypothetical protein
VGLGGNKDVTGEVVETFGIVDVVGDEDEVVGDIVDIGVGVGDETVVEFEFIVEVKVEVATFTEVDSDNITGVGGDFIVAGFSVVFGILSRSELRLVLFD